MHVCQSSCYQDTKSSDLYMCDPYPDITERQIEMMMSWVENDILCFLKELNYSLETL